MNFFMEVAKLRAARMLWAETGQRVRAQDPTSRCRCAPTARPRGWSPDRAGRVQQRVAHPIEAMAAAQGHTQSLHTNALDEALALPTDFSARIARNTQLFLQQESGTTRVIDPWGGSYYVERLTRNWRRGPRATSTRSSASAAWPRRSSRACRSVRIEEAAARTQARIDAGRQAVIGVNAYRLDHRARSQRP